MKRPTSRGGYRNAPYGDWPHDAELNPAWIQKPGQDDVDRNGSRFGESPVRKATDTSSVPVI